MTPLRTAIVCAVFASSGAAALVFEALFFRLCGLVVGNGVEAVAIVLSSFMLGMAFGNLLAARVGDRVARPFHVYASLELVIATSGLALVMGLPLLPSLLASVLRPVIEAPMALNAVRGLVTFLLVMVPSTAMGATLPILVRALSARDPNFGRVLGRLYGWNTLGAVVGVLATEGLLLGALGVRGAGVVAAALDLLAAVGILALARREAEIPAAAVVGDAGASGRRAGGRLVLAAAFASGGSLLALEVVWFRLFVLFRDAFAWNLAVMLAVVLGGIAAGGLAASRWFRSRPDAHRHAALLPLIAGALVAVSYSEIGSLVAGGVPERIEWLYFVLTFPVAFVSGVLFPMLGRALQATGVGESRAAGWTTLSNTVGSAVGSPLAGYLLLPRFGIEWSFFIVALGYGGIAGLLAAAEWRRTPRAARGRGWPLAWAALLWAVALTDFGFGDFERRILAPPGGTVDGLERAGYQRAALRDGLTGTIQYFRKDLLDEPHEWALVTDGHAMAGATLPARRYMKLYVYWPAAVHPGLRDALLISYGMANTAQALTEQPSLEHIDVVDISRDILDLTGMRFPDGGDPLDDPRVHTHVEDGRFFLQTTSRRYDLITAEPPPPRVSGVENLYSQQYFELIRDRLRAGGIVTYWLPVYQFHEDEAKAVVQGFCAAFPNCSLWIGAGLEWMMVGIREPFQPPTLESFTRPWLDPVRRAQLADIGLFEPFQLASLYLADAERLRRWVGDAPPLDDDHPHRIAPFADRRLRDVQPRYDAFMSAADVVRSFRRSEWVERVIPSELRDPALAWLAEQHLVEMFHNREPREALTVLHRSLEDERLAPYRGWLFGFDSVARAILREVDRSAAARGELPADVTRLLVGEALEAGDLSLAARLLDAGLRTPDQRRGSDARLQVYLLLRAGEADAAAVRLAEIAADVRGDPAGREALRVFWSDVRRWLGVDDTLREAVRRGLALQRARSESGGGAR